MLAGVFFLLELLLIGIGSVVALAGLILFGGWSRNRGGLLALGLYMLGTGVGLSLLPLLLWPIAQTDNAFIGHFLLSLELLAAGLLLAIIGAVGVRRGRHPWSLAGLALLLAAAGMAGSLGLLTVRGPEPWQTRPTETFGSGTSGFDIILAGVAIGAAVFLLGREAGRRGRVGGAGEG